MEADINAHVFHSPKFRSVVREAVQFFEGTPLHPLPPAERFVGAGVYALYYIGDCEYYQRESERNRGVCSKPLYVGKAVPKGWRKGRATDTRGAELFGRLRQHARNLSAVADLAAKDFRCRFVLLLGNEADLIVPVEAALIDRHKPLWNGVVDGFGNHDPGSGRHGQKLSEWDILHPGRSWVARLKGKSQKQNEIIRKINESLGR